MARLPVAWLLIFLFHSLTFAKFHTPTLNHASGVVSNTTRPSQQSENESFALKSSSTTLDDARELVAKGQAAMARANAQILNNTVSEAQQNDIPALNYEDDSLPVLKRSLRNGSESSFAESYTVPTELVEAARVMAETSPLPENNNSKYLERSQAFKADVNQNDTFTMAPVLKKSNRLSELASESPEAYRFASNQSELVQPGGDQTVENQKRSASTWWMANIEQRGSSPFASKGYKVWRNVKDYGAKGDGRKDDTEAINLAISDGGRCDQNCSGSTIYPATVYFPPGLYVVSSPILQFPNTEIIGDALEEPRIVAAPSFIGSGVIVTNTYTGKNSKGYPSTRNSLRSIRNLYIDIRYTPQDANVCGIYWESGQGSSIENVVFWADDSEETTQRGLFVRYGSGGFISKLAFFGGKHGMFIGNSQSTASEIWFADIRDSAIQFQWDWGWTLLGINFQNVKTGIKLLSGGGTLPNSQLARSLVVTDIQGEAMDAFISSSVLADNSTSLLVQNALLNDVDIYIVDESRHEALLAGDGNEERIGSIESWGFGRVVDSKGNPSLTQGGSIEAPERDPSMTTPGLSPSLRKTEYYFRRSRPRYADLGGCDFVDVRAWGAKGDGQSDDTAILNYIFSAAANMSAVVFIPHGVYIIKDTVTIPVGSRVIGQAWPQMMGVGPKFEDTYHPRPVFRVGVPGNQGVVEIQSLLFTTRGPTAGAVLLEWNVHESFQGSCGLWDSHFRVGGAEGSDLQTNKCQKGSTEPNEECIAVSLMLHITPKASAYLENIWAWAADHDIDSTHQSSIDIYTARGVLIESTGPTWLWGTTVEHCVLYQYQLTGARKVIIGMLQTESPYFQPRPPSPKPFQDQLGAFFDDPGLGSYNTNSSVYDSAWGLRVIDSSTIYVLTGGLSSRYRDYSPECVGSGAKRSCQDGIFYTEQSSDIWMYNLITTGTAEMISPHMEEPVLAAPNRNGLASTLLSWHGGINGTTGQRDFDGYVLYSPESLDGMKSFSPACQKALQAKINCHDLTHSFRVPRYHGVLENSEIKLSWVCNNGCQESIDQWVHSVETFCNGTAWPSNAPAEYLGGYIQYGLKEQCQKDQKTGEYCNDIIVNFDDFSTFDKMRREELCSPCYVGRLQMMQASPYSIYGTYNFYQDALEYAKNECGLKDQETEPQPPLISSGPKPEIWCLSDVTYTTRQGDTCNSIALTHSVSSASVFMSSSSIQNCSSIDAGISICLPLECKTYIRKEDQDCQGVRVSTGVSIYKIQQYNPWISADCNNIKTASQTYGNVLCISATGGEFDGRTNNSRPDRTNGQYTKEAVPPPEGAEVAQGTTLKCGRWHVAKKDENCVGITQSFIAARLFRRVNPSLSEGDCTAKLVPGKSYCTGPVFR